jgi:hypothetical protein
MSKKKEVQEDMIQRVTHFFILFVMLLVLSACGGGGGLSREETDDNSPDPVDDAPATLSLIISTIEGEEGNELSSQNNLRVTAQANNGQGMPLPNTLVTFSLSDPTLASFNNDTGTALTNSEGQATIDLEVGSASGSGEVFGTISIDDATGSVGFTSLGPVLVDDTTVITVSIAGQDGTDNNTVSESSPLVVSALVTNSEQVPLEGELVTFTLSDARLAMFNNTAGTALTDASGVAQIGLVVGEDSGSGLITASVSTGESGTVGFNSEGTATQVEVPASLSLFSSAAQLASSGLDTIELTAIVRNAQNILLDDIAVDFSADSEASLENTQPVTDSLGTARANLTTINNPENRVITVTGSIAGFPDLTRSITVSVVGTSISISGATSIIINDGASYTVQLQDSADRGIANEAVTLVVTDSEGNDRSQSFLSQTEVNTNTNGQASFMFTATASGNYTLSARAINAASTFQVTVQEDEFGFIDAPNIDNIEEDLPLNEPHTITLRWLREGVPFVGGTVSLSSSRGEIANDELTTNANGEVVFTLESDNAGLASVIALGRDNDENSVSATTEIAFIATQPATIQLDATPDSIGPDGETSTITAIVRDAAGNRVGNQVVNFSVSDVSNGSLSPAQGTTDRSGVVSTVYTSNSSSTNEAVFVTASIGSIEGDATLTVGDTPFDISLGTGNLIESPNNSTYSKEFSIFVTDSDGNPVAGTDVTMSILPLAETDGFAFFKGTWSFDDDAGFWVPVITDSCVNEDENGNGMLDEGEDTNGDGLLTPGNAATITPASVTTDDNGQALVNVVYPRQFGQWVNTRITARAQSNGTESRESMIFGLTVAADDLMNEASPPPSSPYGVLEGCNNFN